MEVFNLNAVFNSTPDFESKDGARVAQFWNMSPFEGGSTWVGKWKGESPWEMHARGDEFLYVLNGSVEVVLKTSAGIRSVKLSEGSTFVVPKGVWHKQVAQHPVVTMGATPGVTEHSDSEPQ